MGLIGSNGAGKTTIIKLLMGLYVKDKGDICILGEDPFKTPAIKDQIGFVYDNPQFYDFKLKKITKIIRPFYSNWDHSVYKKYITAFKLSETMRFKTMSRGMKLKYNLALALSHHAKLLILDEPTSGLDPVFRNEFLSLLLNIRSKEELSILFSSHITDDIEKIADSITYIRSGEIIISDTKVNVFNSFQLIKGRESLPNVLNNHLIGIEKKQENYTALITHHPNAEELCSNVTQPMLEDIMYFHERSENDDAFNL
ncbi:ABC transporter ATP-binding protein [Fusibacter sp. A1]|nr:ABC transporter ATP-binding protein [Fusibacter sp. A2]NPE20490.1 ABC transporter ATP-binding protein [Fusibacter sp. A1]RXV63690.1 ABC transporter ATP-binding protein [Fusibacter sp. A1]